MVQTPTQQNTLFGLDISVISDSFRNLRRQISKRNLLLEFGKDSLTFGEARLINDEIIIEKLNKIDLPESSIDRGTPIDSDEMANLIKEIISQEQLWAHRVSIVLPPEAALCKVIDLPSGLNIDSARSYITDSKAGFQFPIPLNQTDFDLIELGQSSKFESITKYFVFSIPKKLVDNVILTLDKSGLELTRLEISIFAHARLIKNEICSLLNDENLIILDLTNECTYFSCFGPQGPLLVDKISAIREFPYTNKIDDDINSIEEQVIKNDNYLEITELDIKVLIQELSNIINNIIQKNNKIKCIYLIGLNSSHPGIDLLIEKFFDIKVEVLRPDYVDGISDIGFNKTIIRQSIGRLLGISLSLNSHIISQRLNTSNESITNKIDFYDENLNETTKAFNDTDILSENKNEIINESLTMEEADYENKSEINIASKEQEDELKWSSIKDEMEENKNEIIKESLTKEETDYENISDPYLNDDQTISKSNNNKENVQKSYDSNEQDELDEFSMPDL